jgi:hypothetical protein
MEGFFRVFLFHKNIFGLGAGVGLGVSWEVGGGLTRANPGNCTSINIFGPKRSCVSDSFRDMLRLREVKNRPEMLCPVRT